MAQILIIEPDKNQRLLLTEELEEDGHATVASANAGEALAALSQRRPDLVVLAAARAGMKDADLVWTLRTVDPRLPVVVHSAYDRGAIRSSAADAYVLKRSDFRELKRAIRQLLSQARTRRGHRASLCPTP